MPKKPSLAPIPGRLLSTSHPRYDAALCEELEKRSRSLVRLSQQNDLSEWRMGDQLAAIRDKKLPDKLANVMLAAPDVDFVGPVEAATWCRLPTPACLGAGP